MIIDKTDLAILRHMERSGCWFSPLPERLKINSDEIVHRIKKLEDGKVISNYKASIFIPPFLGGDWTWGCVLGTAKNREKTLEQILKKIPFISEIWLNSNIPEHLGHNFSLIFYSKDFETEVKFIQELTDVQYITAYRISNFSFPMARILSEQESQLLKAIVVYPLGTDEQLAETCHKTTAWIKAKKEKLVWNPQNVDGVIFTLPEIQYAQIENFSHCHFIVEFDTNLILLLEELKLSGYELVSHGQILPSQKLSTRQYAQLELDVWGFDDLISKKAHLDSFKEIKVLGIIFAEKMIVVSKWVTNLLQN